MISINGAGTSPATAYLDSMAAQGEFGRTADRSVIEKCSSAECVAKGLGVFAGHVGPGAAQGARDGQRAGAIVGPVVGGAVGAVGGLISGGPPGVVPGALAGAAVGEVYGPRVGAVVGGVDGYRRHLPDALKKGADAERKCEEQKKKP